MVEFYKNWVRSGEEREKFLITCYCILLVFSEEEVVIYEPAPPEIQNVQYPDHHHHQGKGEREIEKEREGDSESVT